MPAPSSSPSRTSRSATTRIETARTQNARAILHRFFAQAQAIEGAIVVPIAPPPIPGIGTTGGFEFWIQDTGAGDPVALDEVTQDFMKKARARSELTGPFDDVSRQHAAVARQRRSRQGDAARRADPGRLQRDPGAVRLAHRKPVQPVQPRMVGHRPVGRAVPAESGGPDAAVHALESEPDGAVVGAGHHAMGLGPGSAAAFQRLSRRQDQRQRGAGLQFGRRDRGDGERWRRKCCRRAIPSRGRASRSRKRSRVEPPRSRSCSA